MAKEDTIKKGMTAIAIANEIQLIINRAVENEGEMSAEDNNALTQLDMDLNGKMQSLCYIKTQLESQQEYFKNIKIAAEQQIKNRDRAIENIKKYMANVMKAAEIKKIKDDNSLFSISLTAGRTRVVVDDVDKLEFQFTDLVTTIKPKTDAIKAALEAGQEVSGAHLETGADFITIRGGKAAE